MGKDQPPDLAALVPSDVPILPDTQEKTAASVSSAKSCVEKNPIAADTKSTVIAGLTFTTFSCF